MSLKESLGLSQEPLFLLDGTAFLFRFFFTARAMQRTDGFPTNILVGLTRLLLRIRREEHPKYFCFVQDGHGKNFRHAIFPDYKANREATPEDLVKQIAPADELVKALGFSLEVTQNFEADDCLASMAKHYAASMPVVIISGDKDLLQCLDTNVFIWNLAAKEEKIITAQSFREENHIEPHVWADVQALIGDTADNIPGVPGIGPKTALKIFATCSSLEEIRSNLHALPLKISQKLVPHLEEMFTWRSLTTLSLDYPHIPTLSELRVGSMDGERLRQIADTYELVALKREIEFMLELEGEKPKAASNVVPKEPKQALLCMDTSASLPQAEGASVSLISPPKGLLAVAVKGADGVQSFQYAGDTVAFWQWLEGAERVVVTDLKAWLADPLFAQFKARYKGSLFDLGLACYLVRPDDTDFSWQHMQSYWAAVLAEEESEPARALLLADHLKERLAANGVQRLYDNLEMPLREVLFAMEREGIAIDRVCFQRFLDEVQKELAECTERIYAVTGETFNIRSSQQLANILTTKLNLSVQGKTKGGQLSTSQQNLEKLVGQHPVIEAILHYRKLEKLRSTYLEPLPRLVDAKSRIHTTFDQMGTATGRLSSKDPNLQNIPVRGEMGERMRSCFVASEGCLLLASDYSQIELRMLAHMSQDPTLLDAFQNNRDIHAHTASVIYDVPLDAVTKEQRRSAKTINFGLIYGMGAVKLAQELHVTSNEAKAFITNYFAKLTRLKQFYEEVVHKAKQDGFVVTVGGRRRNLPDLLSANNQLSAQAGRQAINTVIQGSAADVIKMAMLAVANDSELAARKARLLLQVHDELVMEVPEESALACGERLASIMEGVRPEGEPLTVPLLCSWGVGKTWAEAH